MRSENVGSGSWRGRALGAGLLALALVASCGVGTYRAAPLTGELQMRLVARDAHGETLPRWFTGEPVVLEPEVIIESAHVREVHLENMPDDTRHIVLHLDEEGTQRLAEATQTHDGRRLAVVVDGRVVVAPTIRGVINEGVAHVTVDGDIDQVFDALTRVRR